MSKTDVELKKNGIEIICPIDTYNKNVISTYVAKAIAYSFPELKKTEKTLFIELSKVNMYIVSMPNNMANACYYYKTNSIYFRQGIRFSELKNLALHECIHHFQEVKDARGNLKRLGLCTYKGFSAVGNALNEASVQFMTSYASNEFSDVVKYYGITLPTDSPDYYPLLVNLVKQIGFLTGFSTLFNSTFYATDDFFDQFKEHFGAKESYAIQQNFDKILKFEENISIINAKIQTEDMSYNKYKQLRKQIEENKDCIKTMFFQTQNTIVQSFFDKKVEQITSVHQLDEYRQTLYSLSKLIGVSPEYTFFNNYYANKMTELDEIHYKLTNNIGLTVVKKSPIQVFFKTLKQIIGIGDVQSEFDI